MYEYRSDVGLYYEEFPRKSLIETIETGCDVKYEDNSPHADRSKNEYDCFQTYYSKEKNSFSQMLKF